MPASPTLNPASATLRESGAAPSPDHTVSDAQALVDNLRRILADRWRLMLPVFGIVAAGITLLVLLLPARYDATMKFLVRNSRADMVVSSDRAPGLVTGEVTETEMNSELELLRGRDLLEQVATTVLLADLPKPVAPAVLEKAIRQVEKNLHVAALRKTNVISATYTAARPEAGAAVLRVLSTLYLEKHLKAHQTEGAFDFFRAQAEHYRGELARIEKQMGAFRVDRDAIAMDVQRELLVRRRHDVETRVAELDASIGETRARITRLRREASAMPRTLVAQTRAVPNQFAIERLRTMVVELTNRRTELLTKFRPDDRTVKEVDRQIADTQSALDRVQQSPLEEQTTERNQLREGVLSELSRAQVQLDGLLARRDAIGRESAGVRSRLASLDKSTLEHEALSRQLKAVEANFQLYEVKSEEARIAEALDHQKITNVTVAEGPTASAMPTGPNRPLLLIVGLMLAAFLSVCTAGAAEYVVPFFRSAADRRPASAPAPAPAPAHVPAPPPAPVHDTILVDWITVPPGPRTPLPGAIVRRRGRPASESAIRSREMRP